MKKTTHKDWINTVTFFQKIEKEKCGVLHYEKFPLDLYNFMAKYKEFFIDFFLGLNPEEKPGEYYNYIMPNPTFSTLVVKCRILHKRINKKIEEVSKNDRELCDLRFEKNNNWIILIKNIQFNWKRNLEKDLPF